MLKKRKTVLIYTRCKEYKEVFHINDNILFCNYYNVSVEWKYKSIVENYCKSQKHILNVKNLKERQNNI